MAATCNRRTINPHMMMMIMMMITTTTSYKISSELHWPCKHITADNNWCDKRLRFFRTRRTKNSNSNTIDTISSLCPQILTAMASYKCNSSTNRQLLKFTEAEAIIPGSCVYYSSPKHDNIHTLNEQPIMARECSL